MQNSSMTRSAVLVAGALSLAGAFFAGAAYAADPRLDQATDLVTKALALLKATENPDAKDPKHPFEGHRREAVDLLTRAQGEIAKAKQVDDMPKPKPKPPEPGPTPKDPKGPTPKPSSGPVAK